MNAANTSSPHAGAAILAGGLACGVLDITAAFILWGLRGASPMRILQGIATGLLGRSSFQGGWGTAALGLGIHFLIAFTAAAVFYLASRQLHVLTDRPFVFGPLFGVAVYLVMYWVVIPLSQQRPAPFSWTSNIIAVLIHIVCVGTPIALAVRHYSH
jgi:hypothetical protein